MNSVHFRDDSFVFLSTGRPQDFQRKPTNDEVETSTPGKKKAKQKEVLKKRRGLDKKNKENSVKKNPVTRPAMTRTLPSHGRNHATPGESADQQILTLKIDQINSIFSSPVHSMETRYNSVKPSITRQNQKINTVKPIETRKKNLYNLTKPGKTLQHPVKPIKTQ